MSNSHWSFPIADGGADDGFNNPGMEIFRGSPVGSLVRETLQNSLDACKDSSLPVEVKYSFRKLPLHLFPGRDELIEALTQCRMESSDQKSQDFFQNAIQVLLQQDIEILTISDCNTVGLTGADGDKSGNWHRMVKSEGVSNNPGPSGGSFGIGKNAIFNCSSLRTAFYSTMATDGEIAFQGVTKLSSHQVNGEQVRGTGYYGLTEGKKAIRTPEHIPDFFKRAEFGTDVHVAGFNDPDECVKENMIRYALEDFMIAFLDGRLIVSVDDIKIDKDSYPIMLERYLPDNNFNKSEFLAKQFYQAYTAADGIRLVESFDDLGEIELFVQKDDRYKKRIAMYRSIGMRIYNKDRLPGLLPQLAGVLIVKGDKLNQALRESEPPSHDKWEDSRVGKDGKRLLKEINNFIRERLIAEFAALSSDEANASELGRFLPDDVDDGTGSATEEEGDPTKRSSIPPAIIQHARKPSSSATTPIPVQSSAPEGGPVGDSGIGQGTKENQSDGGYPPPTAGGAGKNGPPHANGSAPQPTFTLGKELKLASIRSIWTGKNYRINLIPSQSITGAIRIVVSCDDGVDSVPIARARLLNSTVATEVPSSGSIVGPLAFAQGQLLSLEVEFDSIVRYALEVSAYAIQTK